MRQFPDLRAILPAIIDGMVIIGLSQHDAEWLASFWKQGHHRTQNTYWPAINRGIIQK